MTKNSVTIFGESVMKQRCRDLDRVLVTRAQLIGWSARLVRLAWSLDNEVAHRSQVDLAMELKSLADTATGEPVLPPGDD